jgi:hypothetical protein
MKYVKYLKIVGIFIVFVLIAAPQSNIKKRSAIMQKQCNFNVIIKNTTNQKAVYSFNRIDHSFQWPAPITLAGGELQPKKSINLETKYTCGIYFMRWEIGKNAYTCPFEKKSNQTIILTPDC